MSVQVIRDATVPHGRLPFSPALRVGNLIFVSGQASVDRHGEIVPDSFEGEMRRSLANLRLVLAAAGLDLSHVAQIRGYVGRAADLDEYNRLYREYFSEPFPARTTLIGCLGDALKFEIDAIAVACSPATTESQV